MFVIFGWGKKTLNHYGPAAVIECPKCNNKCFWKLTKVRTWFTLFFIPVFPYESKWVLHCEICQAVMDLNANEASEARQNVEKLAPLVAEVEAERTRAKETCPQCGNGDVRQAYVEDGGMGHWCPHCKKSLEAMGFA